MKYVAVVSVDLSYLGSEPSEGVVADLIETHLRKPLLETLRFEAGTYVLVVRKVAKL